jgi:hypothetical protein
MPFAAHGSLEGNRSIVLHPLQFMVLLKERDPCFGSSLFRSPYFLSTVNDSVELGVGLAMMVGG